MFRVDAQHAFAPPHQGPDWLAKILARNKFSGSVYVPLEGSLEDALALAAEHSYIQRVVPTVEPGALEGLPAHARIVSVRLTRPEPRALAWLAERGLAAEVDAGYWPFPAPGPVALDGMPAVAEFPPKVYIKLTGFRLPATAEQAEPLRRLLRHPGPERLMYASGWPRPGASWKETLAAFTQSLGPMPIPLREQLLGGTAREFYRL
jgi:hypothetical protein